LRGVILQIGTAIGLVVALVCVAGVLVSRNLAESEAVHDAASLTDVLASSVLQPTLVVASTASPDTVPAAVNTVVRTRILSSSVVRVKIWNPQGRIIYSDEGRLVGRTFGLDDDARGVLTAPQTRAEISDLGAPENVYERGSKRLLEVYRPVWTSTGQPLLFEVYIRYHAVTARTSQLWRGFAGIMLSSVLAIFALLLPLVWALIARTRRAQGQREEMMRRSLQTSDEERQRIAAGLHDGVVQQLAAASFEISGGAEVAHRRGEDSLGDRLDSAAARVRTGIGGLRSLLVDIYPPSLQDAGLADTLAQMAATVTAGGPVLDLDLDEAAAEGLTGEQQQAFFRIGQEALRNAVAHAGGGRVSVVLAKDVDQVRLEIADDGVGLPDPQAPASPKGHLGLSLMRDVAAEIGATLAVAVPSEGGTRWRLTVPA
jgi:signal transduction histidine kinase